MNPPGWEDAARTLQRHLDPNHQSGVNSSMEDASRPNNHWATYCQYSSYTADEPQSSMGVKVGWRGLSPPPCDYHIKEAEVTDPDGEPLEMDEEDPELIRKRNELRQIEEQILCKKVAIALKTVEPFVKETRPGFSCDEQAATYKAATLKDRVNVILQQRHPGSFLSKVRSPKGRMNSSRLSRDDLLQDHHPLKLRVKALMKQRCSGPCVYPKKSKPPFTPTPPPSQSVTLPAKEEDSANQGFQRFLSVLNKGVDMDLLSRIVNDDSEDLLLSEQLVNIQAPAAKDTLELPFRCGSQRSNSGASLPGCSRTSSGKRKADPPSRVRSLNERLSFPDEDKKKNDDGGGHCFGSSGRSKPPSAERKKNKEEDAKVDEQHEQLQSILHTLGLSLEVEEMSKLSDRTQERLYGKKHEGTRADGREEQESGQRGSHKQYRNSSSSSSSSSRSKSRSFSSSPSRRRRYHGKDLKQRASERSSSADRSKGGLRCEEGNQDGKEAQRHRDGKETSTYPHPGPQNHTYPHPHPHPHLHPQPHPHPHPAAFSAFPGYSLSQYSQYNTYGSGTYSAASGSYWTNTNGAILPFPFPPGYPYPQNTYHYFPGSIVAPAVNYSHRNSLDTNLYVNPDLSKSEGQMGLASGRRCLQVITTKQPPPQNCVKLLAKKKKKKRRRREAMKKAREQGTTKQLRRSQRLAEKLMAASAEKAEAEADPKAPQSEKDKEQPTEEEIMANLRIKLEAFNQKAKQNVTQPANSLSSQTG